ncbi:ParB N-terminal domain-containing protein [Kitasatospora sp. NPDC093806]|uniref:ParB N-terminal domain-containing protein n=1 Tax=Kitasatospora sp. NPDC093806 TaxID=3155075 RepID=UPI003415099D
MELVPVGALLPALPADSPRSAGEDLRHTQLLAQSGAVLPPIIVHRPSMRVVDGTHRLRAAIARGEELIRARFFDGPRRDAFLLAVRENTAHGLPLSLADRAAAATRIIRSHGHWSDRAIAETAGLSASTVREIRRATLDTAEQPAVRLGRDGRTRPLNSSQGRVLAGRLMAEMPTASLRQIARLAGISPGTVRDVRARLGRGEDPVPAALRRTGEPEGGAGIRPAAPAVQVRPAVHARPAVQVPSTVHVPPTVHVAPTAQAPRAAQEPPAVQVPEAALVRPTAQVPAQRPTPGAAEAAHDHSALLALLAKDPSLKYAEHGRLLLRLLSAHALPPQHWRELIDVVPGHSLRLVSQAARACAETWEQFADGLERKA